jgi:sugar phosphate isomerase/epimerase
MTNASLSFGVACYSFPCGCGFARREGTPAIQTPLDAWGLIDLAVRHRLRGVEMPLTNFLPECDDASCERLRSTLQDAGLSLVVDSSLLDGQALEQLLPLAARSGASIVRVTMSTILEGARATLPGGWQAHYETIARRIVMLQPLLHEYDLRLAIENHQDVTMDELLRLCDMGGPRVGVTFDVVNPLAVGEEPFRAAHKAGDRIFNVHLKDYRVYATPSGYRLVRCALGEGIIDWPAMLALLARLAPEAPQHIELAALYARHIRLFEDDWWQGYPSRDAREFVPTLRLLARYAYHDDGWPSPWERDLPAAEVARWEMEQFERSVAYLAQVTGDR